MREFMNRRSGGYRLPIPTDELIRLLEERADKVDTYADLLALFAVTDGQQRALYHVQFSKI